MIDLEKRRARIKRHNAKRTPLQRRNEHLRRSYGLSNFIEYDLMVKAQKGRCAICGVKTDRFRVDHDHRTKRIRGLLCNECNCGIGFLKDSAKLLLRAAKYVKNARWRYSK